MGEESEPRWHYAFGVSSWTRAVFSINLLRSVCGLVGWLVKGFLVNLSRTISEGRVHGTFHIFCGLGGKRGRRSLSKVDDQLAARPCWQLASGEWRWRDGFLIFPEGQSKSECN